MTPLKLTKRTSLRTLKLKMEYLKHAQNRININKLILARAVLKAKGYLK